MTLLGSGSGLGMGWDCASRGENPPMKASSPFVAGGESSFRLDVWLRRDDEDNTVSNPFEVTDDAWLRVVSRLDDDVDALSARDRRPLLSVLLCPELSDRCLCPDTISRNTDCLPRRPVRSAVMMARTLGRYLSRFCVVASSDKQSSRTARRSSGTPMSSLAVHTTNNREKGWVRSVS